MVKEQSSVYTKGIFGVINKIGDIVYSLHRKIESLPAKTPEIIAIMLYLILHIVISAFHEPWFDEAVAWQIAKCASIKDIFFNLPHYEGHPPLWHLILLPFAKGGCPYEFSLAFVSMIFSGLAVGLIIWKSPFPRIIRLLLPFTYFLFYQYGIISRPYCVMMLAFVLAAICYADRDEKPWRFVLSLALLCLSSAYGILISGGIVIAWLIELMRKEKLRFLMNKRRTVSLLFLLVLAVLLIVEIFPSADTAAVMFREYVPEDNSLIARLIYLFFVLPSEVCASNVWQSYGNLEYTGLSYGLMASTCVVNTIIWGSVIYAARKRGTVLTLIIPYSLFAIFAALTYICLHHSGIALLIFIFWAWITFANGECISIEANVDTKRIIFSGLRIIGVVIMAVSLYWGISASVHETYYIYAPAKNEAEFISENNLDDYRIMTGYTNFYAYDENGKKTSEIIDYNLNSCIGADNVSAYFDKNIFFNFNNGRDDMAYTYHKVLLKKDSTELVKEWRENGLPDVLYEPDDISEVYGDTSIYYNYTLVYYSDIKMIWKYGYRLSGSKIYVKKELAEKLGLEEVEIPSKYKSSIPKS